MGLSFGWNPLIGWISSSCSTGTSAVLPACHGAYKQNLENGSVLIWLCCQSSEELPSVCSLQDLQKRGNNLEININMLRYFLQSFRWVKRDWSPVQAENITDLINFFLFTQLLPLKFIYLLWALLCTPKISIFFFFLFRIKTLSEQTGLYKLHVFCNNRCLWVCNLEFKWCWHCALKCRLTLLGIFGGISAWLWHHSVLLSVDLI